MRQISIHCLQKTFCQTWSGSRPDRVLALILIQNASFSPTLPTLALNISWCAMSTWWLSTCTPKPTTGGHLMVLLDFSLTVKAATLIFISGSGSAISSAKQGKSGYIYNLVKNKHSRTCLKRPLKKNKKSFQDRLSLNAGQKYCRMLLGAFCSTFDLH